MVRTEPEVQKLRKLAEYTAYLAPFATSFRFLRTAQAATCPRPHSIGHRLREDHIYLGVERVQSYCNDLIVYGFDDIKGNQHD